MKKQSAGLLAAIFLFLSTSSIHSQDEANKAIREYKEKVAGTNEAYTDSVEGAREKKRQGIAAATEAALKALKDELAKTGPGDVAMAIALAKRIYQLDSTDKDARKILLAANVDLGGIKPVVPEEPPTENSQKAAVFSTPPITPANIQAAANNNIYPIQKNKRPLTLPGGTLAGELKLGHISGGADSLIVAGSFGIVDNLEVGIATGVVHISEDGWSDTDMAPIDLYSRLSLSQTSYGSHKLDVAASAALTIFPYEDMNYWGDGDNVMPFIRFGLPSRLTFADDAVAVRLGHGLIQYGDSQFPGGGLGDDLSITLNLGVDFQVTDNFNISINRPLTQWRDIRETIESESDFSGMIELQMSYSVTPAMDISIHYLDLWYDASTIFLGVVFRNLPTGSTLNSSIIGSP